MDLSEIVQVILAGGLTVLGWFLREMWTAVQDLKGDLNAMRADMPIVYVQKVDYKSDIGRVHELLDKIYERLENKADR